MDKETILEMLPSIESKLMLNFTGDTYLQIGFWKKDVKNIPENAETTSKKVIMFQNLKTGKRTFEVPDENFHIVVSRNSAYRDMEYVFDVQYIPEINCVALCRFKIYAGPIDEGKTRDWELDSVYFVTERKEVLSRYNFYGEKSPSYMEGNVDGVKTIVNDNCISDVCKETMIKKAFEPLFPIAAYGANKYHKIDNAYNLVDFLSYKEPTKRNGPKQKKVDSYLEKPLPPLCSTDFDFSGENSKYHFCTKDDFVVIIDGVEEGLACLRWIYVDKNDESFYECSRLYVNKNEPIFCRRNSLGEYISLTGKLNPDNFMSRAVIIRNKGCLKNTKLEYYESIINEVENKELSVLIWCFLYQPLSEKFYKIGFSKCIYAYLENYWCAKQFDKFLITYFGNIDLTAKSPAKILGLNNYQFNRVIDYYNSAKLNIVTGIIKDIKTALRTDNIASYTNDIFDALFDTFASLMGEIKYYNDNCQSIASCFAELFEMYSLKTAINCLPNFLLLHNKTIQEKVAYSWPRTIYVERLYIDYIHMVHLMGVQQKLRPYFNDLNDIENMHDGIQAIYNLKREVVKKEAFNSRKSIWEKFIYDNEKEDLCVIYPNEPEDLAKEGITLQHCVKSYIDKVTNGTTNIVFIRKKDDMETPFFTVEISNTGDIEQVHGFANRNANTEPGLEDFVKRWAKTCKLNMTNFNKVR